MVLLANTRDTFEIHVLDSGLPIKRRNINVFIASDQLSSIHFCCRHTGHYTSTHFRNCANLTSLKFRLIMPKPASGENYVCPTGTNMILIARIKPTSMHQHKYCLTILFFFCPTQSLLVFSFEDNDEPC